MFESEIARELRGLYEQPVSNLIDDVNIRLIAKGQKPLSAQDVSEVLTSQDLNSPAVIAFHRALAYWDTCADNRLNADPGSLERRRQVLAELGLLDFEVQLNDTYPVIGKRHYVISSSQKWQKWYEPKMGNKFYWNAYRETLASKGYDPDELEGLSASIDDIMRRIAAPYSENPYQAKGLVVGHVQSGKTSHFTGLIAKAISSGYKLVIVLTGTIEMLRAQTQRRLDMELVGKENILSGRNEQDFELLTDVDYVHDSDWDKFASFGRSIAEDPLVPEIIRLTTFRSDFKSLKQGLDALDFQKDRKRKGLAVFDPENLASMPVRLMVLKKNSSTLQKVIKDLKSIHTNLQEVPALIIDDEADQASPNTKRPIQSELGQDDAKKERTAINQHISTLLSLLPRAQYVGYTATPFANVFIEPDDYEDIFPKDFIISLKPSSQYMGSRHFHDIDVDISRDVSSFAESNEAAFARRVFASNDVEEVGELMRALDAFVLTGAIKLFREDSGFRGDYRHHTMLAHTSAFKQQHTHLKALVDQAWQQSAYYHPTSVSRLWDLMHSDFMAVARARSWEEPFPQDQATLSNFLGEALSLIDRGDSPAVVVNSDSDLEARALNFKDRREWRVVIGGAKLSRGFTVEGLTISYFRRRSVSQDAMLQMGRWFGYRPGYGDLVRLFIGKSPSVSGKDFDLYDAFTATVRDEEEFRSALVMYSELSNEDGSPQVTPAEIPPLVYQQLGWLRPTSRNKMYNAVLTSEGYSEKFIELARHAPYQPDLNAFNFQLFAERILCHLAQTGEFRNTEGNQISARYGLVPAADVHEFVFQFKYSGDTLKPKAKFIQEGIESGAIQDFFVMIHLPKSEKISYVNVPSTQIQLPVVKRSRRENGSFVGTERRNRGPLETISGKEAAPPDPLARSLRTETRASMLIEIVGEEPFWSGVESDLNPAKVAVFFGFVFPFGSAPHKGRIAFQAAKRSGG